MRRLDFSRRLCMATLPCVGGTDHIDLAHVGYTASDGSWDSLLGDLVSDHGRIRPSRSLTSHVHRKPNPS